MSFISRSRSRSPIGSTDSRSLSTSDSLLNTQVLHLYNIPKRWGHDEVKSLIKEKNRTLSFGVKYVFMIVENNRKKGECLIRFTNAGVCKKGLEILNGIECEGKILRAEPSLESISGLQKQDQRNKQQPQDNIPNSRSLKDALDKIKFQVRNMKPSGSLQTYGLSMAFLNSLGIKPPLCDKIFIANLDSSVTEQKIREVFGLAGHIVAVQILIKRTDNKPNWAKVEYDHPVEAVQAISMLHDKDLFGKKLIVQMDTNPKLFHRHLPEGLSDYGPGLGENGSVLKGVRTTVELQLLKAPLKQQGFHSEQNHNANQDSMNQHIPDPLALINMQNNIPPLNNMVPINQNTALLGLQSLLNPQLQHGMFQTGGNDLMTALATLQSQNMAASVPIINQPVLGQSHLSMGPSQLPMGPSQLPMGQSQLPMGQSQLPMGQSELSMGQSDWSQGQRLYNSQNEHADNSDGQYGYSKSVKSHDSRSSRNEPDNHNKSKSRRSEERGCSNPTESDMLVFNNLPSSVTLEALNNKMREVGDVKFAEITGQGRAIVRFFTPRDAERCINLFDRSKVDGQTIDVRFF